MKSVAQPGTRGHGTHRVGDPLPVVIVLSDLGPILGLSRDRLWRLELAGAFAAFELHPRLGKRARYSGKKIQAWLDGETPEIAVVPRTRATR